MGWLDMLRRRPPIRDGGGLADFIDAQAAFLMQKGIYEYSRARAGHFAKVLLDEPEFLEAVERSRWLAYPLGLAMVAEATELALRPLLGDRRRRALDRLIAIVLAVFDRYPVPTPLGETPWRDARRALLQRLEEIGLRPPKLVKDIPEHFAEAYFALMPIHEQLRGRDYPAMRSYLKIALCNIHDELVRRMDAPALAAALCGEGAQGVGSAP